MEAITPTTIMAIALLTTMILILTITMILTMVAESLFNMTIDKIPSAVPAYTERVSKFVIKIYHRPTGITEGKP
jgi:hypothetical protein